MADDRLTALLITYIAVTSCGELKPKPCSVQDTEDGTHITCPDGTESLVKGASGEAGPKGETGTTGSSGEKGDKGETGPKGDTGLPAIPGASWAMYSGTTRVGKILTNPLDAGFTTQVQNDPTIVEVEPNTFGFAYVDRISQGRFSDFTSMCNFESSDCSGNCLIENYRFTVVETTLAKPKAIYQIGNDAATSSLITIDLGSSPATKTIHSLLGVSGSSCSPANYTALFYSTTPYTLPNGLTYPISAPNFKIE